MPYPLTLQNFLERSRKFFGKKEIVSREDDGSLFNIGCNKVGEIGSQFEEIALLFFRAC